MIKEFTKFEFKLWIECYVTSEDDLFNITLCVTEFYNPKNSIQTYEVMQDNTVRWNEM